MQSFVNVYIEINTSGTYTDLPQAEKNLQQPNYYRPIQPRRIESGISNNEGSTPQEAATELSSRLANIISQNNDLAKAADYMLDKISSRFGSTAVKVDPDENADIYRAMTELFGDKHNGVLTYRMYIKLLEYTYIYGEQKVRGNI